MEIYKFDLNADGFRNPKERIERILCMISILKFSKRKTRAEHARSLGVSERQIRRDLQMLERFFEIEYDLDNRPFIIAERDDNGILLNFTREEIALINSLVESSKSKIASDILRKTNADLYFDQDHPRFLSSHIERIRKAIKNKKQIRLKYTSGSSPHSKERILEPVDIIEKKYFTAFDIDAEKMKMYAFERVDDEVEVLKTNFEFQAKHRHFTPDLFGMYSGENYHVILKLSQRAYLLLREEYPRAALELYKTSDTEYPWKFDQYVNGLEGIGRFVMGLSDHIQIEKGEELKLFLRDKAKKLLSQTGQ